MVLIHEQNNNNLIEMGYCGELAHTEDNNWKMFLIFFLFFPPQTRCASTRRVISCFYDIGYMAKYEMQNTIILLEKQIVKIMNILNQGARIGENNNTHIVLSIAHMDHIYKDIIYASYIVVPKFQNGNNGVREG